MQIVLEVIEGPHRGHRFTFDGHDNFIVGRARAAHFRLPQKDPYFSRVHFMVEVNPPHCRMVDMGSTNGTGVNGVRVDSADLEHGDLIQGGDTVLRVSFIEQGEQPDEPVAERRKPPPLSSAKQKKPPSAAVGGTESFAGAMPELSAELMPAATRGKDAADAPVIEGYEIVRELGRGGMGVVYLATRSADSSPVALKTIRPAAGGSGREVKRFLREATILRKLRHAHVVAFHEMGHVGELLYFAMDYVPGIDAARLLGSRGPLAIDRAVRLMCQALMALDHAHALGFVHRDVKPANLLICKSEGVEVCKLADFGLARVYHSSSLSGLTLMGDAGGTMPYMPPEQITRYRDVSPLADQYSAAATLYRLLTGHHVLDFEGVPSEKQLTKILFDPAVPIRRRRRDIPQRLADVIHQALAKEPAERFPNAAAFRAALMPFTGKQ